MVVVEYEGTTSWTYIPSGTTTNARSETFLILVDEPLEIEISPLLVDFPEENPIGVYMPGSPVKELEPREKGSRMVPGIFGQADPIGGAALRSDRGSNPCRLSILSGGIPKINSKDLGGSRKALPFRSGMTALFFAFFVASTFLNSEIFCTVIHGVIDGR